VTIRQLIEHLKEFGDHLEVRLMIGVGDGDDDRGIATVSYDGFTGAVLIEGKERTPW
jgi:hypothetical protein